MHDPHVVGFILFVLGFFYTLDLHSQVQIQCLEIREGLF